MFVLTLIISNVYPSDRVWDERLPGLPAQCLQRVWLLLPASPLHPPGEVPWWHCRVEQSWEGIYRWSGSNGSRILIQFFFCGMEYLVHDRDAPDLPQVQNAILNTAIFIRVAMSMHPPKKVYRGDCCFTCIRLMLLNVWPTHVCQQLENSLNEFGEPWELNSGDGAFYGPKVSSLKKHTV